VLICDDCNNRLFACVMNFGNGGHLASGSCKGVEMEQLKVELSPKLNA
jgi:hypothetical protein